MSNNTPYHLIKKYLHESNLEGILISRTDSFLGEYYPPQSGYLQQVTGGFSGSAGLALITKEKDVLFVDSRYTIQAKKQTAFQVLEVPSETTPSKWIKKNMSGQKIGFNPWTHSVVWYHQMRDTLKEVNTQLVPFEASLIKEWYGTDNFVPEKSFDYDIRYTGVTTHCKCQQVAQVLKEKSIDAFVIGLPENVSWLLNKRSKTVLEYPVVFERGVINVQGEYAALNENVIAQLKGKRIGIDLMQTPVALYEQLKSVAAEIVDISDPINEMKAVKNDIEIKNIKEACLYESYVICRFLAWVEQNKNQADEIMCDEKLIALRRENPDYIGDSFATIAAVGGHAALAHYRADEYSNLPLTSAPLLLVDTGGHYMTGTTDMTRTIAIGTPTPLMKKRYTQVLQGHIDLAMSSIKIGESTASLDEKAHAWLRADGVDYYHGTSHGIGMLLAVHENPPVVSKYDTHGLRAGMVFSNEPAYYSEAEAFGIRLETMLLSILQDNETLVFENLLLVPFDSRLVNFDLLTNEQKQWLKSYHQRIEAVIFPMLNAQEQHVLLPFIQDFQNII